MWVDACSSVVNACWGSGDNHTLVGQSKAGEAVAERGHSLAVQVACASACDLWSQRDIHAAHPGVGLEVQPVTSRQPQGVPCAIVGDHPRFTVRACRGDHQHACATNHVASLICYPMDCRCIHGVCVNSCALWGPAKSGSRSVSFQCMRVELQYRRDAAPGASRRRPTSIPTLLRAQPTFNGLRDAIPRHPISKRAAAEQGDDEQQDGDVSAHAGSQHSCSSQSVPGQGFAPVSRALTTACAC
jgi:hypothetical protein